MGDTPDWLMFVKWRSKLFMGTLFEIQRKLVANPTAFAVEDVLWDIITLRNVLFEVKLINENDLKAKPFNYFQKVALIRKSYGSYLFQSIQGVWPRGLGGRLASQRSRVRFLVSATICIIKKHQIEVR